MNKNNDLTIKEIFNQALQNHQNNNLDIAEKLYNKIIKIDPNHSDSLNNLGLLFFLKRDNIEAIKYFKKTLEINTNNVNAYYNLGLAFNEIAQYHEAIDSYEKTITLDPNYKNAYNNLALILYKLGDEAKAIRCFEKAIEIDPNYVSAHNNLGVIYKDLSEYQKAKTLFEKTIRINPAYTSGHCNLGIVFHALGDIKNTINCYERVIEIDPSHKEVLNNLGLLYQEQGDQEKSIHYYKKAITIDPNFASAHYSLGILLYETGEYKKALEHFKVINFKQSKGHLLSCLYKLDDQSTLLKELDLIIKRGEINAMIGSLTSRSEIKYKNKIKNPFCGDPLNYVLKTDLNEVCDFKNIFVKTIKNILDDNIISGKKQTLLTNGMQTTGDLFSQKNDLIEEIKDIIITEVNKYQTHYKDSQEGLIKSWPTNYKIRGWLICMKSGGKLKPHIHEQGWLSGSIYINVPPKIKVDSGNLVVCIDDKENNDDKNPKKIIDVVTGSLCLFPASLYHYTIPFESDEDRIVLAFDVIPKDNMDINQ